MRADRLLRLTWILSGRSAPIPAAQLAAELEVGCRVGALAAELEVPTWVIEAWRRTLRAAGPDAVGVREREWHRAR